MGFVSFTGVLGALLLVIGLLAHGDETFERRPLSAVVGVGIILLAAAAFMLVLRTATARAEDGPVCAPFRDVQAKMAEHFHEVVVAAGKVGPRHAVTVLATPDGATFTILIVDSNGVACPVMVGLGWSLREKLK